VLARRNQFLAMPKVHFTANLTRHVSCPTVQVEGATVGEVLSAVFEQNPRLRSYVVDEQGTLRKHMNVFVDAQQIRDRERLGDPVSPTSEIYVMQALSGG
jgi:molybdopterin synthase sulfur carrier subunit